MLTAIGARENSMDTVGRVEKGVNCMRERIFTYLATDVMYVHDV